MSRNKYGNGDSNWYEYDWRYNGVDAEYCVDLSYDGREDELPQVLLSMRCKGGKKVLPSRDTGVMRNCVTSS